MLLLLPYRTDRPRIRPAYLTAALILACALVQVCASFLPHVPVTLSVGGETLTVLEPLVVARYGFLGDRPSLLTLLAHSFVHDGWLHLAGNMLFLWIFGSLIEDAIRPWSLAALYLGGGILAAVTHVGITLALGQPVDTPLVGASGAVAALMGLFMLRFHKTRVGIFWGCLAWHGTFWVRSMGVLLYWAVMQVLLGILTAVLGGGGTAHWAHVGGFLAGALAAPFLGSVSAARQEYFTDDPETNVEYVRRNEAVAAVERALRSEPGNAYEMRRLAQAYRHAGEYERATRTYHDCICRFAGRSMMDQAASVYLELLEHDEAASFPPDVLAKLAQHLETTHVQQSVAAYQALVRQHVTRPEAEQALLRLSTLHSRTLAQPAEAVRCLAEFLQRYPNSHRAGEARSMYESLSAQPQPE